jgi:hypothetical protein
MRSQVLAGLETRAPNKRGSNSSRHLLPPPIRFFILLAITVKDKSKHEVCENQNTRTKIRPLIFKGFLIAQFRCGNIPSFAAGALLLTERPNGSGIQRDNLDSVSEPYIGDEFP